MKTLKTIREVTLDFSSVEQTAEDVYDALTKQTTDIIEMLGGMKETQEHDEMCDSYCEEWGCRWPDIRVKNKTITDIQTKLRETLKDNKETTLSDD